MNPNLANPLILNERKLRILELREIKNKNFREIGIEIGCSTQRANQLYKRAVKIREINQSGESRYPYFGLSTRIATALESVHLNNRGQIETAVKGRFDFKQIRNFGFNSYCEMVEWLGHPTCPPPATNRPIDPAFCDFLTPEMRFFLI